MAGSQAHQSYRNARPASRAKRVAPLAIAIFVILQAPCIASSPASIGAVSFRGTCLSRCAGRTRRRPATANR